MIELKNKSVFLFGYYGRGNIGDDIMLNNILNLFLKKGVSKVYLLVGVNYQSDFVDDRIVLLRGIKSNIFSFIFKLIKADLFFWGGGTCFFDNPSLRGLQELYVFLFLRNACGKVKNYFIGIGVEPLRVRKEIVLRILKYTKGIILRDEESLRNLNNLYNNGKEKFDFVEVFDDIVFLNYTKEFIDSTFKTTKTNKKKNYITFSGYFKYDRTMAIHTARELVSFVNRYGGNHKIVFLPAKYKEPSDSVFHQLIIDELVRLDFKDFENPKILSSREYVSFLSSASFHIGMRLHSIILADILGVKNIALAYQNKIIQYTNQALDPHTKWAEVELRSVEEYKIENKINTNSEKYESFFS